MTDTWCPIPWNFQAVRSNGDLRVCCQANITKNKGVLRKSDGTPYNAAADDLTEARNSDLMKIMRQNMLDGVWSDECGRCRSEEESGLVSRRNYEHDRWSLRKEDVIEHTATDGTIDTNKLPVTYYDLRFGNLCNLACRMCGPQDSTGWYDDWNKLYDVDWFNDTHGREQMFKQNGKWFSNSYGWHDSDSFWKQIEANAGNVQHVYMAGGEPLLIERHYEFLERCIENGAAANMLIEYNTNMTTMPSRVINLWKNFKMIQLGASIDGYGKVLEYQRYPAEWSKVWRNIQKVDAEVTSINAWFAYTVTAYNVLHMPEFMKWKLSESGLTKFNNTNRRPIVTHHVAHNPPYLNIRVLPAAFKELVVERFNQFHNWVISQGYSDQIIAQSDSIRKSIIDYMMSADYHPTHWEEFKSYTAKMDKIRGENVIEIIPEIGAYL
jgi:hypothetical protein